MSGRENTASDTDDIWEIAAKAALDRSKKNDSPGNRNDSDESEVLMDMEPLLNVIRKYYIYKNFWFKVTSFVCWIFVVAFFYAFVYANQDAQDGFYITHSFEKAFSGDPLVIEFEDIANIEDTFIYMNNIFEGGFQEMDDGKLAVGDANIITELVFFQNRVKAIDCDSVYVVEQAYSNPANGTVSCIPVYSESVAETKPFGPNNEWTYQKFNKFHEAHFTYSYSSNGYAINVPLSKAGIRKTIKYIEENGFIDKQSSNFIVVMASYNYNLDMYFSYVLGIELAPGGEAFPCVYRSPLRMTFDKKIGYLAVAIIFLILNIILTILYFTFKVHIAWTERRYKRYLRKVSNDDDEQTENDDDDDDDDGQTENDNTNENTFTKIKRNLTYNNFADAITILFKSLESLFNVIFILDVLFFFGVICAYSTVRTPKIHPDSRGYIFESIYSESTSQETWIYASSFAVFIGILVTFNHLAFVQPFMVLWSTLGNGAIRLLFFLGMFVILVFGFMFLIHNLYGSFVYTVSKFPDDFLYVMTSAFDGVDYSDLETFHPRVSIVYYVIFAFVVITIFLNIFVAVLNDAYEDSKPEEEDEEDEVDKAPKPFFQEYFPSYYSFIYPFILSDCIDFFENFYIRSFSSTSDDIIYWFEKYLDIKQDNPIDLKKKNIKSFIRNRMNNKTPIKNFIKNRMNNIIHEKDLDSYFFSLFSEKHMYKVFGVNTRIDTLIAIRESNKKFIDDELYLIPTKLSFRIINERHKENMRLESDSYSGNDVDNVPANIFGVYLSELQPDTYVPKPPKKKTEGKEQSGSNVTFCTPNLFRCDGVPKEIKTVRGQTKGEKLSIRGRIGVYFYYNPKARNNKIRPIVDHINKIEKELNDIIGHDRLIFKKECLVKGLPCEKCFCKLYKFFEGIANQLNNSTEITNASDKRKIFDEFYEGYTGSGNWEVKTFSVYVLSMKSEEERRVITNRGYINCKGICGGRKTFSGYVLSMKSEEERRDITNRGYINYKDICGGSRISIHDLFLVNNDNQDGCTMMCANCFIELVRRRVDEVSGLPNAFEIAHKNGLKPKLITRCLIPEGFIDGIDVVSCSEFNSLEDDISKISGSSDTSQLWIYDSACESSKSNDRNKHIFEISEYMEDIVSQLPQSSSSQTEMIQKKDKKTKRLKAKTLTVNKKIASIDTDGSTNP